MKPLTSEQIEQLVAALQKFGAIAHAVARRFKAWEAALPAETRQALIEAGQEAQDAKRA